MTCSDLKGRYFSQTLLVVSLHHSDAELQCSQSGDSWQYIVTERCMLAKEISIYFLFTCHGVIVYLGPFFQDKKGIPSALHSQHAPPITVCTSHQWILLSTSTCMIATPNCLVLVKWQTDMYMLIQYNHYCHGCSRSQAYPSIWFTTRMFWIC